MKLGKTKLRRILSEETGIPVRDIIDHGKYENFGNKEQITIGSYVITALHGEIKIWEPVITEDEIGYRNRTIKRAPHKSPARQEAHC